MSIEVSKIIRNSVEYKKCVFNGIEWEVPNPDEPEDPEPDEPEDPEEPEEELPLFYETMLVDLPSHKIDENVPDSIPMLAGCLGFVDGWFDTSYGKDLENDEVINWYTESPVDLGQIYEMGITSGQQHANDPQFRDPYFAVGYIDGYLDHPYLANELIDNVSLSERLGYDDGYMQGRNAHTINAE